MPHGSNHGITELDSQLGGDSTEPGTCDVIGNNDSDNLHHISQPVTSNIIIPDITYNCDLWNDEHHVTSLSSHFGYFFFVQRFITRCLIAVCGRLSTTSSLLVPQEL